MIKEIMLASSIMSNSLVPIVQYDLWNNGAVANTYFNVGDIRSNDATNICINLNDGTFFTCNLVYDEDGGLIIHEIYDIDDSNSVQQPLNYYDYLKYIVNTYSPFHNGENGLLYTHGELDLYFDLYIDNLLDLSDIDYMMDSNLNFFLGTYVINNNAPYFIQTSNNYVYSVYDSYNYMRGFNIYFDELIVGDFFNLDNMYLIIQFREFYFDDTLEDNYYFDFDINFKYDNGTYIDLSNEFYPNYNFYSIDFNDGKYYTEFIYQSLDELENENIILSGQNDYLRRENEELNSKHVFSNTFELIRGALDGVVNFFNIELMTSPRVTIGMLFFIPVVVGVIWFILKALVL